MSTAAALDEGVTAPLTGIRRTAARHMVKAWAAPVFHLTVEVDMGEAMRVKEVAPGATVTDVLVRAATRALGAVPEVNAHVGEDAVTTFTRANVGIAVATEKGLTVPVVHGAESLTIDELAVRRGGLVQRAREGALTRDDITGGTFTISNLGMMGVARFDAILNVPQAAILAVGATIDRFVLRDGVGEWRPIAELTLTCDHRAIDGAIGARFLVALREALSAPVAD